MNKTVRSSWDSEKLPTYPQLKEDLTTDTLIIGAGLTGVLTAYLLAKEGKKVTLIDKEGIANGATMYTTAFLTQLIDTSLSEQIELFGKQKTKEIWDSHGEAISLIEKIVHTEKILCEFTRCDLYQYAFTKKEIDTLQTEYNTAKNLHIPCEFSEKNALPFPVKGFLKIPNQAKFHPIKFLSQLLPLLTSLGVNIYFETEALTIQNKIPSIVKTKQAIITANTIVVATHLPFHKPIEVFAKKGVYISYVYELSFPKNTFPEALFLDSNNPYHYFRVDKMSAFDRVIIGGEDHRRDFPISKQKSFDALREYVQKLFRKYKYTITKQWYGPIIENDALAYIGKIKKNQYIATGFSGNGMTYAGISSIMFTNMILNKNTPWKSIYDPKRIPSLKQVMLKGKDYTEEFINAAIKNTLK